MFLIYNFFQKFLLFIIFFSIFISVFFIPILQNDNFSQNNFNNQIIDFNPNGFVWPIPGFTTISSPFGKRKAPAFGASNYHYGIDIPAPEGTALIAVSDGKITFCSFLGAGGYTITLSFNNFKVTYCHVSPNFIVSVNDFVKEGQIIGHVGPKYVYGVLGNPYFDSSGKPTNRCNYSVAIFIFGFRIDDQYVNPLDYF